MSDVPFHQTRMGQIFYEGTMPRLVLQLTRLNDNIERLLAVTEGGPKTAAESTAVDADPEDRT